MPIDKKPTTESTKEQNPPATALEAQEAIDKLTQEYSEKRTTYDAAGKLSLLKKNNIANELAAIAKELENMRELKTELELKESGATEKKVDSETAKKEEAFPPITQEELETITTAELRKRKYSIFHPDYLTVLNRENAAKDKELAEKLLKKNSESNPKKPASSKKVAGSKKNKKEPAKKVKSRIEMLFEIGGPQKDEVLLVTENGETKKYFILDNDGEKITFTIGDSKLKSSITLTKAQELLSKEGVTVEFEAEENTPAEAEVAKEVGLTEEEKVLHETLKREIDDLENNIAKLQQEKAAFLERQEKKNTVEKVSDITVEKIKGEIIKLLTDYNIGIESIQSGVQKSVVIYEVKVTEDVLPRLENLQRDLSQNFAFIGDLAIFPSQGLIKIAVKNPELIVIKDKEEVTVQSEEEKSLEITPTETLIDPATAEATQPEVESKETNVETITQAELKKEIENIIESKSEKLKEKNLTYKDLTITGRSTGFQIEAHFRGRGLANRVIIGSPDFIAEIKLVDGQITVPHYELDANPVVSAFVNQKDIDNLAQSLGNSVKEYIEKNRGKEVERFDMENGALKVTYKAKTS